MSHDELNINLEKRFDRFGLRVEAALPVQGITAIFGPSGSGKSTLLSLIAGFQRPDTGSIRLGSDILVDTHTGKFMPPYKRPVSIAFQGGQLLPHKTVLQNLIFADKRARRVHGDRFENLMDAFEIEPLTHQKPHTLSGGQRQRVAIAQAILARPALLLLDEPLSAFDAVRKARTLSYLDRVQREYALPMLYVSHDIAEVAQLADRVLFLEDGKQVDFGPAVEILNRRGFQTDGNQWTGIILTGQIGAADHQRQLVEVTIDEGRIFLPLTDKLQEGRSVRIIVRAADIALSLTQPEGLSIRNALRGTVSHIHAPQNQPMADIRVDIGQAELPVRITRAAAEELDLRKGLPIYALVKTAVLAG